MMLAAHSAAPVCPRCDRRVRSGVELQAAVADLEDRLARVEPLRQSSAEEVRSLHAMLVCLYARYARELRAELSGEHLDCGATGLDEDLVAHALSRATAGAAPERSPLQ